MEAAISTLKNHLPELVHQAESGEDIQITRHGKPVAVIVSLDRYQQAFKENKGLYHAIMRWREEHPEHIESNDEGLQIVRDKAPHEERPSPWDEH